MALADLAGAPRIAPPVRRVAPAQMTPSAAGRLRRIARPGNPPGPRSASPRPPAASAASTRSGAGRGAGRLVDEPAHRRVDELLHEPLEPRPVNRGDRLGLARRRAEQPEDERHVGDVVEDGVPPRRGRRRRRSIPARSIAASRSRNRAWSRGRATRPRQLAPRAPGRGNRSRRSAPAPRRRPHSAPSSSSSCFSSRSASARRARSRTASSSVAIRSAASASVRSRGPAAAAHLVLRVDHLLHVVDLELHLVSIERVGRQSTRSAPLPG